MRCQNNLQNGIINSHTQYLLVFFIEVPLCANHLMPEIVEDHNHQKVRRKIGLDLMIMGQLQI